MMKRAVFALSLLVAVTTSAQVSNSLVALRAIQSACSQLLIVPGSAVSLQNLSVLSKCVQDADLKAAMVAAYAMGQFYGDQAQAAAKTVQYLQKTFPASPHLALFQGAQYQVDCPKCLGSGTVEGACSLCGGKGTCRGCSGRGTIPRLNAAVATCLVCRGSGQCSACKGLRRETTQCLQCFGRRKVVSKDLMKAAYLDLIRQTQTLAAAQEAEGGRKLAEEQQRQTEEAARDAAKQAEPGGADGDGNASRLRALARKGDAGAQYELGTACMRGEGAALDYQEGVKWLRKSAEQGHAKAMFNLGLCYRKGYGVAPDTKEGFRWWKKAAENGDATAMVNVGVFYLDGMEGVAQDRAKGMAWFRKAAASKDEKAIGVLRKNALSGMSEAQTVLIDAGLK